MFSLSALVCEYVGLSKVVPPHFYPRGGPAARLEFNFYEITTNELTLSEERNDGRGERNTNSWRSKMAAAFPERDLPPTLFENRHSLINLKGGSEYKYHSKGPFN